MALTFGVVLALVGVIGGLNKASKADSGVLRGIGAFLGGAIASVAFYSVLTGALSMMVYGDRSALWIEAT